MIKNVEITRIAKLAKLNCSEEETSNFASQLTEIMDMINILNEIDCNNVEPLISVDNMEQRMRKDEILSSDISEELFANLSGDKAQLAKEVKCFIVPKIVE